MAEAEAALEQPPGAGGDRDGDYSLSVSYAAVLLTDGDSSSAAGPDR